jgi:hypothetical protein
MNASNALRVVEVRSNSICDSGRKTLQLLSYDPSDVFMTTRRVFQFSPRFSHQINQNPFLGFNRSESFRHHGDNK